MVKHICRVLVLFHYIAQRLDRLCADILFVCHRGACVKRCRQEGQMKPLGKGLPPVKDIAPPSQEEQDKVIALWNANCPPFYIGLMEAAPLGEKNTTARFLYDRVNLQYIHRKTRRVLSKREVGQAFVAWTKKVSGG